MSLTGTIPSELGALTNIVYTSMRSNMFTGSIPSSLGAWTKVQIFNISLNTNLGGSLPSELGNWKEVRYIGARNCSFVGHVPSTFTQLESLNSIYLANNQFSGPVNFLNPATQPSMENIDLSFNAFR